MVIDSSGNVGIGKTNPLSNLDVVSSADGLNGMRVSASDYATNGGYLIMNKNSGNNTPATIQSGDTSQFAPLALNPNGGSVSVGMAGYISSARLGVMGGIGTTFNIDRTGSNSSRFQFFVGDGTSGTGADVDYIYGANTDIILATGGSRTSRLVVANDGGIYTPGATGGSKGANTINASTVYANGTALTSDERLKTSIAGLPDADGLAIINQLNPVTFKWKDQTIGTQTNYGFIAQQVQAILPDLVNVGTDAQHTLSLNYEGLIAPSVKAIQELDTRTAFLTSSSTIASIAGLPQMASTTLAMQQTLAGYGVRLDSVEARLAALEAGATGSTTGTTGGSFSTTTLKNMLLSFGAVLKDGIFQARTLAADRFVAATDAFGHSSAGAGTVLAGNTAVLIENPNALATSKVFVSFTAPIQGGWYVADKQDGSFRVMLTDPQTADASFDYFILETEGQVATSTAAGFGGGVDSGGDTSGSPANTGGVVVRLHGSAEVHLAVGAVYEDAGVDAHTQDGTPVPYTVSVNGISMATSSAVSLDTSAPGQFTITYTATDEDGDHTSATRAVYVDASAPPAAGGEGAGDIGTSTPPAGPTDTTAPTVSLTGAAAMSLAAGSAFTDPGATATDDTDGDLTASITETGSVDATTPGVYTLTYSATDAAGNTGSASRVVTVE
jgi:hypothetical protein